MRPQNCRDLEDVSIFDASQFCRDFIHGMKRSCAIKGESDAGDSEADF